MIKILSLGYPSSNYGGPYYVASLFKKILNKKKIIVKNGLVKNSIFKFYFFKKKKLSLLINKFDIIHIHNIFSIHYMFVLWIAAKFGIPYIISSHGNLNDWSMKNKKLSKKIYLYLFKGIIYNSRAFHVLNKFEKNEVSHYLDISKLRFLSLPNFIDAPKIGMKIKNTEFKVLFFGRLTDKKGIFELLKIIRLFKTNNIQNIKFVFVGPKEKKYHQDFVNKINSYQIDKYIEIKEEISDELSKKELFETSDIFVLPSKDEADSISIKEALIFGKSLVISSNCKFEVSSETNEFINKIKIFNEVEYYNAIMNFYNNQEKLCENVKKINSYAKKNFSVDLIENELANIYYDCISYSFKSKYWKN